MNHTTYHLCKNGRQQPGSREECPNCTPAVKKINAVIVKQAQQIAALKVALQHLLDISEIAEFYMPGELAESADKVSQHIAEARALLAKSVTEKAEGS
jgi:hypothetical protein